MPFAYAENERWMILITHGFWKKRDKAPPPEIARAKRILLEDAKAKASKVFVITDQNTKRKRP
jgi:hypothetical protein